MIYPVKSVQNYLPIIVMLLGLSSFSQVHAQYLQNPSLESLPQTGGEDDINLVDAWETSDSWSNPNFYTIYLTTPRDTSYTAVDGEYFALFRARGVNYDPSIGYGYPSLTREYIYEKLSKPLDANSCFKFTVYLCYNPKYSVGADTVHPDTAYPVRFQAWGGFGPNDRSVLLADSPPIRNTSWKQYTFHFNTPNREITYFLIEVAWDTVNVYPHPYCGFALVDDMDLEYIGKPEPPELDTLVFHGNNIDTLKPRSMGGTSYSWSPGNYVSDSTAETPLLTQYTDTVKVLIKGDNSCPETEVFKIYKDCASLYPNDELDTENVYFKFEKGLHLDAKNGVSWQWEPKTNLSADNVKSPVMTGYNEFYQVHIHDRFGCVFVENFHIIWNCDTLYPNGELVVQNDTLTQLENVTLNPFIGQRISAWSPPEYLSCTDCESPVASPRRSITYSVQMKDNYQCVHTEKFVFTIPLKIPNVITPNGDGSNDCFKVFGLPENTTFYLFDKSGRTICAVPNFETVQCWDGSQENLRSGTYWYAFENPKYGTLAKGFLLIVR